MANVVFVLGAGASAQCGVPVMKDFLDVARELLDARKISPELMSEFDQALQGRQRLARVHEKSSLDLNNIESVLSALEMGLLLGGIPGYGIEELNRLILAFKVLITTTIESTMRGTFDENKIYGPEPYNAFALLLKDIKRKFKPTRDVAVITFNYDVGVELALHLRHIGWNYYLEKQDEDTIPILKLHGSVSWERCETCGKITPVDLRNLDNSMRAKQGWYPEEKHYTLEFGPSLKNNSCCGKMFSGVPFIVPPILNKSDAHAALQNVWCQAAHELSEAEYIFVIGYSYPESDSFFKHLYSLGTVGDKLLRALHVYNIEKDGSVEGRIQGLLGPGALSRFVYFPLDFCHAIDEIEKLLGTNS